MHSVHCECSCRKLLTRSLSQCIVAVIITSARSYYSLSCLFVGSLFVNILVASSWQCTDCFQHHSRDGGMAGTVNKCSQKYIGENVIELTPHT